MTADWTPLRRSLAACRANNHPVPIWWRDDDAVTVTRALDHLTQLAQTIELPVHLAVIPNHARRDLPEYIATSDCLVPVVHGWSHADHAPEGAKKSEFGVQRPDGPQELTDGLARMRALFGAAVVPLFVPPWNRLDPCYYAALVAAGYRGVSTFTPRKAACPAHGLIQINTHIDPIDWHGTRGLREPERLIAEVAILLDLRRAGQADALEPMGYLTHHLVHDAALWDFSHRLIRELLEGGAFPQPIAPLLRSPE